MAQPLSSHGNSWSAFPPPVVRARRPKIHLACSNCRDRKTRCDGGRPTCAACRRRDVADTCNYEHTSIPTRRYITDLEDRIQKLEQEKHGGRSSSSDGQAHHSHDAPTPNEPSAKNNGAIAPSHAKSTLPSPTSIPDPTPHPVDALATITSEDDNDHLYGESSTIAFVRQVVPKTPANNTVSSTSQRALSSHGSNHCAAAAVLLPLDIHHGGDDDSDVLPFRRNADDYVHCYLEFVHPLFPLLHTSTFLKRYQSLWLPHAATSSNDEELVFISQVNLVFALGCQFSRYVTSNQRTATANQFYKRSQHVQLYDILGSSSLPIVQWLLLSGIYFQSTSRASHCWNSIGLAIRLAQGLGLHLENSNGKFETQVDREMRRRIWHTCVVLDRLLAMTFGRPAMVGKAYNTPVPLMIDDGFLLIEGEGQQPQDVPSRLGLFTSSCRLFEILADILSSFYGTDACKTTRSAPTIEDMVLDVLAFNRRLDSFIASIPDYLKTTRTTQLEVNQKNTYINLQQQVLYCRFLYTRLLSLRPLLLMATDRREDVMDVLVQANLASLDEDIVRNCCSLCIKTAHLLIETIFQNLDTTYKSTGWHSVYFTFASATILLASTRLSDVKVDGVESFDTSWNRCLSILQHYQAQIQTAPHAIKVLKTLRSQIERNHDQGPPNHSKSTGPTSRNDDDASHQQQFYTNGNFTPSYDPNVSHPLDFSQFNPYGVDDLTNAWFTQQIVNLDAMDFGDLSS